MDPLDIATLTLVGLVALKAIIGFHFPWESIRKAGKRLSENLDQVKSLIPFSIYEDMRKDIDNIS